ncbi:hypothetical protein D3C83_162600 [compost metagenome]
MHKRFEAEFVDVLAGFAQTGIAGNQDTLSRLKRLENPGDLTQNIFGGLLVVLADDGV